MNDEMVVSMLGWIMVGKRSSRLESLCGRLHDCFLNADSSLTSMGSREHVASTSIISLRQRVHLAGV